MFKKEEYGVVFRKSLGVLHEKMKKKDYFLGQFFKN
jgi:hypothetical protein